MDGLTLFEAAHILGLPPEKARPPLRQHGLIGPRSQRVQGAAADVEQVALEHYPWRRHVSDPNAYWVTVQQAAEILDVSPQRVKQLLDKDFLPHVVHRSGVRLMRREQLHTVANARLSRRLQEHR